MSTDTKPTNPKDAIGSGKLPLDLVPSSVETYAAMSFLEGALKYGRFNWRIAGVRFSIYLGAMKRHIKKLEDGEWADPVTKVPHISSIIACAGIIGDARLCGKLTDDRAPAAPSAAFIDEQQELVAHLKEMFKDHAPYQYTIEDSEHGHTRIDGRVLSKISRNAASKEATRRQKQSATRGGEGRTGTKGRR